MDRATLEARIEKVKEQITAVEDAILALTVGGVSQYTLDTGQSRQVVTNLNLATLRTTADSLDNKLCTLQARLDGGNSTSSRPAW